MVTISRQSWFAVTLAAVSLLVVYGFERASSKKPSIALENCQPIDAWARIARAYDPLGFWVEQTIVLESYYSNEAFSDALSDCRFSHKGSPTDEQACTKRVATQRDAVSNCLAFANEMCRREGGRC
jgi:hypothetical protein